MSDEAAEPAKSNARRSPNRSGALLRVSGSSLAALAWYLYSDLFGQVIPYFNSAQAMAAFAGAGAFFGIGRPRKVIWAFAVGGLALMLTIGFTPLVPLLMRGYLRSDRLEKAPAALVLASGVDCRGVMNSNARTRLDRGLEILGQGYAERLILTQAGGRYFSWVPVVERHLASIGLSYPIDSVGPVINTHDEAVKVAALMRQRGWERIILVTHPWHMRRAAAVFEKEGASVICAPCEEMDFDPLAPKLGTARINAFRVWIHEAAALLEYRLKGWID